MKTATLVTMVRHELGVSATYDMCQRGKKVVLKESRGYVEEYGNLWGCVAELMYNNPESTISIQVHRDNDNNVIFHMMYVCFDALKKGWREGCRPFIGVDGCFMKNITQGELLVSVGRNGNNQMFPIAWVVVEGECKESWKWSLTKLMDDLNHPEGDANWPTEISPVAKQKLEKNIDYSSQCRLVWNGHGGFEVTQGEDPHTVDLERLTCTCKEWEINGIPCCHSICAMFYDSKDPHNYIAE
ncbi:hypothetical protein V6N13_123835 [Hibiscus sabdariffa]|uniref:SWIM-type domain-containing protein n=1 Tax=Hibiscus sabdariffa TaxID=183260 RepID=A0ABR2QUQ0_9ROSI